MKRTKLLIFLLVMLSSQHIQAQFQNDTIISEDYFGFDFWGVDKSFWLEVYMQMNNDSFPFGLVGTDAPNWQKIEPSPPVNGVHAYHWGFMDTLVWYTQLAGKKLDLGVRPLSNWGTVLPADSVPVSEWSLVMSPIKSDSLSDTAAWGMTARQAWKEFIFNLVERYDGDSTGKPDTPDINTNVLKTLMIGNEPEAPGHFFNGIHYQPQGNIEKLNEFFDLVYDTAKYANPDMILVRGKSNPGLIFDDLANPDTVYMRRTAFFDSLLEDFSYGAANYDFFAINYNDHYTSLPGYSQWLRQTMPIYGFTKPLLVGDARTTLFPRDNFYLDDSSTYSLNLMPQIYDSTITHLPDTGYFDYANLKTQWQKDKVQQSIKKLAMAAATNQFQISLQPVYVPADFEQGNRTYLWMYSGFFDPYIYEATHSLALARNPLYWSVKRFAEEVMGANKQSLNLNLGNHVYAYKYLKQTGDDPVIIWHENHFLLDTNTHLLQRNQDTTIDMSVVFSAPFVRMKHFITQVDSYGMAIPIPDTIVSVHSVPINEFPVFVYPSDLASTEVVSDKDVIFDVFPNPVHKRLFLRTNYRGGFIADLMNMQGKTIKSYPFKNNGAWSNLEIPDVPDGIYFIHIKTNDSVISKKIIKIKK